MSTTVETVRPLASAHSAIGRASIASMRPFGVGYLIQHDPPDLSTTSGPQLHVSAVVHGLRRLGHPVRTLTEQRGVMGWSDDLDAWHPAQYGFARSAGFRAIERVVRRVQTETRFPYFNLFESVRYADACVQALRGMGLLYERNNYLAYGGGLAARRLGIPWVIELNGNILGEVEEMGVAMSETQRRLGRWITRRAYLSADHVVVVSDALAREVVGRLGIPASRVSVVLNGVDLELFSRPVDAEAMRRRLGLDAGPVVVFVGSFQPWHGVDLLVDAFHRVRAHVPGAQLVLVGDGPSRQTISDRLQAAGDLAHARLPGRMPQSDVAAVLACATVLVAPHAYADANIVGTPLKILEYMASGRAIVASTAPIHELIEHGVSGFRVAPADTEALARGITETLMDPAARSRFGEAARGVARSHSWSAVVDRLVALFVDVRRARGLVEPVAAS